MSYNLRPNQSSITEIEKSSLKNLQIFEKHIQKQIALQQQIYRNYQTELLSLKNRKKQLLTLIQQSLDAQASNDPLKHVSQQQNSSFQKDRSTLNTKLVTSPQNVNLKSPNRSNRLNRSQVLQTKQKQINYLTNINEYKNKDLVDEVRSLMKQLNLMANKTTQRDMGNSSILMTNQSQFYQLPTSQIKDCSRQEQQFIEKHHQQFGYLNKLPTSSPSSLTDQVLNSLMQNLQKEQLNLISQTFKYQQLQLQKMIKQNLQDKTIENMRLIYKEKKRLEAQTTTKEIKSNKDIVKFGYTNHMLKVIQDRTGYKVRLG